MSTTSLALNRAAGGAKPAAADPFIADVEEIAAAAAGDVARAVLAIHEGQELTPDLVDDLVDAFDDLEALRRRAAKLRKAGA